MRRIVFALSIMICCSNLGFGQGVEEVNSFPAPPVPPVPSSTEAELPIEITDRSFDRYVDFALVIQAVNANDAAGLADAGLQLAEGERILARTPNANGINAERILAMAYEVASEANDEQTIARLKKASERLGKNALADAIAAKEQLGGESRTPLATVTVPISMPVEQFHLLKTYTEKIKRARLLRDLDTIRRVSEALKSETELPEEHRKRLAGQAADAQSVAEKDPAADNDVLLQLAGSSRGFGIGGINMPYPRIPEHPVSHVCPVCGGTGRITHSQLYGQSRAAGVDQDLQMLSGASRGWFKDATGMSTPEPIRKIAPNGLSYNPPPQGGYTDGWAIESAGPSGLYMDDGGRFNKNGTRLWNEFNRNGARIVEWQQVGEDPNFFHVRHSPRRLELALPKRSGTIFLKYDGEKYREWRRGTWR